MPTSLTTLRQNSKRQLAGSFFNRHEIIPTSRDSLGLSTNSFRFYFTPLPGFFSPFPHGTSSLSVLATYLALEDGSPRFPQSMCSVVLGILLEVTLVLHTRLSLSLANYSKLFCYLNNSHIGVPQPQENPEGSPWFRLFRFRSPLLTESLLIFFPHPT